MLNFKGYDKKGNNGTILVIGGNDIYTGAPYFTSLAALRSGGELVSILTPSTVCLSALKVLLPEAVVGLLKDHSNVKLSKVTACIIGPGLGRVSVDEMSSIQSILKEISLRNTPLIVDADGIHYYKKGFFNWYSNVIVTPNCNEANNLLLNDEKQVDTVFVLKGKVDKVKLGSKCSEIRGESYHLNKKHIGGQGDILAGIIGTLISQNLSLFDSAVLGCKLLKEASGDAFLRKSYSLITSDVIESLSNIIKKYSN